MCLAYWGYILLCVHAGTHLSGPLQKLRRKHKRIFITVIAASCAVSAYGIYAFIKRQFPAYMFRQTAFAFFDYSEPRAFFFIDYIAVMILFAFAGILITELFTKRSNK